MMKELLKAAPAVALLAAVAFDATSATEASAAEFCRQDVTGHMRSCGFDSMAQCQAASVPQRQQQRLRLSAEVLPCEERLAYRQKGG
jgi:hypothetical protein